MCMILIGVINFVLGAQMLAIAVSVFQDVRSPKKNRVSMAIVTSDDDP